MKLFSFFLLLFAANAANAELIPGTYKSFDIDSGEQICDAYIDFTENEVFENAPGTFNGQEDGECKPRAIRKFIKRGSSYIYENVTESTRTIVRLKIISNDVYETYFSFSSYASNKTIILQSKSYLMKPTEGKNDQDGIIRDAHGNLLTMNQARAIRTCADQKMHLPTIRELAQMSKDLGAKGILETSEVMDGKVPAGFYLVSAINPNGKKDEFYFNHSGYVRPAGDLGNNWFWSSSAFSSLPGGFVFYGGVNLVVDGFDVNYAVRCVAGQ